MGGLANKVITTWPAGLRSQETVNNAAADAELPQILAGRARWLAEMATGGAAASGEAPKVPRNPQGRWGHDHSGPPYGSTLKHPLFGFSGDDDAGGDWTRGPQKFVLTTSAPIIISTVKIGGRVWVRPHVVYEGAPYSKASVAVRARAISTGSTVAVTMQANNGPEKSENISTSTSVTNHALTNTLDLRPGWNDVLFTLTLTTASRVVNVLGLAAFQTVKRTH